MLTGAEKKHILNEVEVATRMALVVFANKHQKLFAISQIRENLSAIEREIVEGK